MKRKVEGEGDWIDEQNTFFQKGIKVEIPFKNGQESPVIAKDAKTKSN